MGKVLIFGLFVLFISSMLLGNLGVATTGGIELETELPNSGWEVVTTGITWLGDALTFTLDGMPALIGSLYWIFIVLTIFIPIAYLVRGT